MTKNYEYTAPECELTDTGILSVLCTSQEGFNREDEYDMFGEP